MARTAIVFDANGTLFSLDRVARLLGGNARLDAWFERLLHSATSLTLAGAYAPFDELAKSTLRTALARTGAKAEPKAVLAALQALPAYREARTALERVRAAGVEAAVLTNGRERSTRKLLQDAGLDDVVDEVISCDDVQLFKPHPATYRHAEERLAIPARRLTLVAAHAWDVAGAKAAGWDAVWIDRTEQAWPLPGGRPRRPAPDLVAAVEQALG